MCDRSCNVILITTYWKGSGGGISVYNYNLYTSLQEQGCKVMVLYVNGEDYGYSYKLSSNKLIAFWQVIKHVKKFRSLYGDNVLILVSGWWPFIASAFLGRGNGKVFYIFHTYMDSRFKGFGKKLKLFEFFLFKTDKVLFVSRGLKKNIEGIGQLKVPPQWEVLYGAPSVRYPKEDEIKNFKRKFGIKESNFYILGHGLTASKIKAEGAKLLISTLRYLPDNVYLILTRKGRFTDELKDFARAQGLEKRVIFTGDLENPHVATVVSDVYTHISWGEGLPLALLEVMAIGKPIVASNIGGIPEAIRHPLEGVLVENVVNQVASAIKHLIENPKLRRKMSVISKKAVNKRFSWEKTAKKLLGFLFL